MKFVKNIKKKIQHHKKLKRIRKIRKKVKKFFKKLLGKNVLTKLVIGIIALFMIAGMVLPYILR